MPRLSGRWVPGIPRGFLCGQIENCPHSWQIPATQPWAPIPGTCHTDKTVEGRKIGMGGEGKDAKWTAPQTTAQTFNEELADPSRVQSYHKPCQPAPLTAGCPLSSWATWLLSLWTVWPLNLWTTKLVDRLTAKPVNCLTAKLLNHLTAKLMNHLTTKLVDRLTAKLVVVNLVKLHLTKFKLMFLSSEFKIGGKKSLKLQFCGIRPW